MSWFAPGAQAAGSHETAHLDLDDDIEAQEKEGLLEQERREGHDTSEGDEDPGEPCCAGCRAKFRDGRVKQIARWGGVISVFGIFLTSVSRILSTCIIQACIGLGISVILGLIELPFCCQPCFPVCKKMSDYLGVFEKYALRGMFYMALAVLLAILGLIANECWYLTVWGVVIFVVGASYWLAHCCGEGFQREEDTKPEGLGIDSKKLISEVTTRAVSHGLM